MGPQHDARRMARGAGKLPLTPKKSRATA